MDARVLRSFQRMMNKNDSLFGENIAINNIATIANVSTLKYEVSLVTGGFEEKIGLNIVINKARGIVPVIGQAVVYNNKSYRIFEVDSDIVSYTFICDSINK